MAAPSLSPSPVDVFFSKVISSSNAINILNVIGLERINFTTTNVLPKLKNTFVIKNIFQCYVYIIK